MTAARPRTVLPMSGPSSAARSSMAAVVGVVKDGAVRCQWGHRRSAFAIGRRLTSRDATVRASLGAVVPPPAGVCVRVGVVGGRAGVGSGGKKAEMNSSTVLRTARPWLTDPLLGDGAMVTARTP
eukprot:CAMPEP_0182834864 /NCGR_PEP_ID=MMETSP0006_2-20121128/21167_1 /TAXON_ID=97485 /ORGANISM="Prymnesium parvum, Strain Texoma1" /LENGTH=124 /DNA_ID=CAMNT_0024963189 /DNA_START=187 /DNA_END=561 /DNA_ORIENTATION=+